MGAGGGRRGHFHPAPAGFQGGAFHVGADQGVVPAVDPELPARAADGGMDHGGQAGLGHQLPAVLSGEDGKAVFGQGRFLLHVEEEGLFEPGVPGGDPVVNGKDQGAAGFSVDTASILRVTWSTVSGS